MINDNIIKGQWKEIKGEIQKKWGQLTNDDLDQVQGNVQALEGLLQKKLGFQQEHARTELSSFLERWTSKSDRSNNSKDDLGNNSESNNSKKETNF